MHSNAPTIPNASSVEGILPNTPFAAPTDVILGASTNDSFSHEELQEALDALRMQFVAATSIWNFSGPAATTPISTAAFAPSQRIDKLSGVTLTDVSGLKDSDIPDDVTATNYLPLTGGTLTGTLSGADLTLSGTLTAASLAVTAISSSGYYGIAGVPVLVQPTLIVPSIQYSVIGLGYGALSNFAPLNTSFEESSHVTAVGYRSVSSGTSLDHITALGSWSCAGLTDSSGSFNTCLGIDTLRFWTSGVANTAVGEHALVGEVGYGGGQNNVAVGTSAGQYINGSFNTALGQATLKGVAGDPLTGNGFNVAVGSSAGALMRGAASKNTAVGANALLNMTTQTLNTAVGFNAALYNTGNHNTAIGASALAGSPGSPLTGSQNVAVGRNALLVAQGVANTNTAIGDSACPILTTGTANTCIGRNTGGSNMTTGSSNILIGAGVDAAAIGQSAFLNIGNAIYGNLAAGNVGIGATNPSSFKLQVAGNIGPNANTTYDLGSTGLRWGCVWTSDGSIGTCASDERLKDNIEVLDFGDALGKVIQLQLRKFTFKDDPEHTLTLGLIAQEAEAVVPELVVTDPETGLKAVRYGALPWLLMEAVKQLGTNVVRFTDNFVSAHITATVGDFQKLTTRELCVGSTCLIEADLRTLLEGRDAGPTAAISSGQSPGHGAATSTDLTAPPAPSRSPSEVPGEGALLP